MAATHEAPTVAAGGAEACPQAWPGGLSENIVKITGGGILHECVRTARHNKHRNADGTMSWWGGKLSPEETAAADALRADGGTR